jgi:hypothetical protein
LIRRPDSNEDSTSIDLLHEQSLPTTENIEQFTATVTTTCTRRRQSFRTDETKPVRIRYPGSM